MNSRKKNNTLSIIILLVVGIGIFFYFQTNSELLPAIRHVSLPIFALLILLRLLFLILNGLVLKIFVKRFDVNLHWMEWLGLAIVTTLGNYITPFSGGMVARATYLKVKHNLAFTKFASLLAASYLITFAVAALLGLGCLFWLNDWHKSTYFLAMFFAGIFLGVVIAVSFPVQKIPKWSGRIMRLITTVIEGWHELRTDLILLLQLFLITTTSMLLNGAAFWLAYQALNFTTVSIPAAVLVSLSAVYSVILTITPGNLGIREALVSLTSELISIGVGEGLLVALLIRLATLAVVFSTGPFFSIWLTRQIDAPAIE